MGRELGRLCLGFIVKSFSSLSPHRETTACEKQEQEDVARCLGVTTSAVNKAANSEEVAALEQYSQVA